MSRATIAIALLLSACGTDVAPAPSALGETAPQVTAPAEHPRLALLPAASQDVVRSSRLPLLVPGDPALLANAIVTAGPAFIALSAQGDGFSMSIAGTNRRHDIAEEVPPPDPTDQVRGQPATFTVNDGIRDVTWDEAGIAWALDVECFDPENDARCASDDYVRSLAESLELIGGGP